MWSGNGGYREEHEVLLHPHRERCIYSIPEKETGIIKKL
jgi:hypothetical protein